MNLVKMILSVFILSVSNSSLFQIVSAKPLNQEVFACNQSFESYAYGLSGYETSDADELKDQWQARYIIPDRVIGDTVVRYRNPRVLFSRVNDGLEIWVELDIRERGGDLEYGIYNVATDEFTLVSASIDNLNFVANQLFVDFNGTVWGIVEQSADENDEYTAETGYYPNVSESGFFPLAYFDEDDQQFKLATGELTFDIRKDELRFTPRLHVAIDPNLQIFWLFDVTSIYRYDPQTQISTFVYDFPEDGYVVSADIDSTGEVYFRRIIPRELSEIIFYQANSLSVLTPETNTVQSINNPPLPFPNPPNVLVDRQDNLWLGPVAYRDREADWQVIHPDIDFALDVSNLAGPLGWEYPYIALEDSSGRIWFLGYGEYPYGASGLAWYDPTTGDGCNTTMDATNIIEDSDGKLWFFDQGTGMLYQTVDLVTSFNVSLTLASLEEDTHDPQ